MAQSTYNHQNQPGASYRLNVNASLQASQTNNSGASPPLETYPFMYWIDTSTAPRLIKQRNASNSAWAIIGEVGGLGLIRYKNALDPVDDDDLVTRSWAQERFGFPVGSVIELYNRPDNPGVILGYGTWVPIGEGRVTIGVGSTTDERGEQRTIGPLDFGGAFQDQLSINTMPEHDHDFNREEVQVGSGSFRGFDDSAADGSTTKTGGGQPHNNMQPYFAVYRWYRSA